MTPTPAITVENLSKVYHVYAKPSDLFWEMVSRRPRHRDFWALRDVSFTVGKGEVVGVIGRNGAGKSTLLKILAGTLDHTRGQYKITGNVSAILELGTGFHPEYTGRDNILMGALCLGMTDAEARKKLDWIIDFSELRPVIDQPFKTYSSGMKARLTFAVAISIEPDVFIVDEALAAGDQFFVAKCIQRIEEIVRTGATVLFVSHALALVERFCKRAIWIRDGQLIRDGAAHEVCKEYELLHLAQDQARLAAQIQSEQSEAIGTGEIRVTGFEVRDVMNQPAHVLTVGKPYTFRVTLDSQLARDNVCVGLQMLSEDARVAFSTASNAFIDDAGMERGTTISVKPGRNVVDIAVSRLFLGAGRYFVTAGVAPHAHTNTYQEFFDVQWKKWAVTVQRDGLTQSTVFEQPVTWRRAS